MSFIFDESVIADFRSHCDEMVANANKLANGLHTNFAAQYHKTHYAMIGDTANGIIRAYNEGFCDGIVKDLSRVWGDSRASLHDFIRENEAGDEAFEIAAAATQEVIDNLSKGLARLEPVNVDDSAIPDTRGINEVFKALIDGATDFVKNASAAKDEFTATIGKLADDNALMGSLQPIAVLLTQSLVSFALHVEKQVEALQDYYTSLRNKRDDKQRDNYRSIDFGNRHDGSRAGGTGASAMGSSGTGRPGTGSSGTGSSGTGSSGTGSSGTGAAGFAGTAGAAGSTGATATGTVGDENDAPAKPPLKGKYTNILRTYAKKLINNGNGDIKVFRDFTNWMSNTALDPAAGGLKFDTLPPEYTDELMTIYEVFFRVMAPVCDPKEMDRINANRTFKYIIEGENSAYFSSAAQREAYAAQFTQPQAYQYVPPMISNMCAEKNPVKMLIYRTFFVINEVTGRMTKKKEGPHFDEFNTYAGYMILDIIGDPVPGEIVVPVLADTRGAMEALDFDETAGVSKETIQALVDAKTNDEMDAAIEKYYEEKRKNGSEDITTEAEKELKKKDPDVKTFAKHAHTVRKMHTDVDAAVIEARKKKLEPVKTNPNKKNYYPIDDDLQNEVNAVVRDVKAVDGAIKKTLDRWRKNEDTFKKISTVALKAITGVLGIFVGSVLGSAALMRIGVIKTAHYVYKGAKVGYKTGKTAFNEFGDEESKKKPSLFDRAKNYGYKKLFQTETMRRYFRNEQNLYANLQGIADSRHAEIIQSRMHYENCAEENNYPANNYKRCRMPWVFIMEAICKYQKSDPEFADQLQAAWEVMLLCNTQGKLTYIYMDTSPEMAPVRKNALNVYKAALIGLGCDEEKVNKLYKAAEKKYRI